MKVRTGRASFLYAAKIVKVNRRVTRRRSLRAHELIFLSNLTAGEDRTKFVTVRVDGDTRVASRRFQIRFIVERSTNRVQLIAIGTISSPTYYSISIRLKSPFSRVLVNRSKRGHAITFLQAWITHGTDVQSHWNTLTTCKMTFSVRDFQHSFRAVSLHVETVVSMH